MKSEEMNKPYFMLDAVHKNISICEPLFNELIACRELQRLKWISQLGGAQTAFPSATHTRFSHSIGVFHILNRVLSEVPTAQTITKSAKTNIKIAGLLHDLGHGPFSHAFEKILNLNNEGQFLYTHEDYTCAIISDKKTEINQVLTKYNIDITAIIAIIKKDYQKCPKYQIQLVSSQLDCDRIDYLMRDSYFTGADYGKIDLEWIITNMIIDVKNGLSFSYKALSAIENYLMTRFHMYSHVYYQESGIIFDINLQKVFARLTKLFLNKNYQFAIDINNFIPLFKGEKVNVEMYLRWTDATLLNLMQDIIAYESDKLLVEIAQTILFCYNWQEQLALLNMSGKNNSTQISKEKLHNVLYDLQKDPIMIETARGQYVPLEKISQIVQSTTKVYITSFSLKEK